MDQERSTSPQQGGMQFDQAELGSEGEREFECSFCQAPLSSSYFELSGQPSCEACRYKVEAELATPPGVSGFFKAAMAGAVAAAVGAGIYYAVLALSGYEIGLVAIVVGFLVGRAVRWGSNGRGGWGYQTLAVGLTYLAIVSTYIPMIVQQVGEDQQAGVEQAASLGEPEAAAGTAPVQAAAATGETAGGADAAEMGAAGFFLGLGALVLLAAALPFLAGIENIMGIIIIGFGLFEAWRVNKRLVLTVAGPFEIGKLAASRTVSAPAA